MQRFWEHPQWREVRREQFSRHHRRHFGRAHRREDRLKWHLEVDSRTFFHAAILTTLDTRWKLLHVKSIHGNTLLHIAWPRNKNPRHGKKWNNFHFFFIGTLLTLSNVLPWRCNAPQKRVVIILLVKLLSVCVIRKVG